MALTVSTGAGNAMLDTALARVNGGTIELRTGARPASPNDAATGTLLATFTLGATAFAAAVSKSASINTVASTTAVATGTAGYARFKASGGAGEFDGTVGTTGAELNLNTVSITSGGTVSVTGGSVTAP